MPNNEGTEDVEPLVNGSFKWIMENPDSNNLFKYSDIGWWYAPKVERSVPEPFDFQCWAE